MSSSSSGVAVDVRREDHTSFDTLTRSKHENSRAKPLPRRRIHAAVAVEGSRPPGGVGGSVSRAFSPCARWAIGAIRNGRIAIASTIRIAITEIVQACRSSCWCASRSRHSRNTVRGNPQVSRTGKALQRPSRTKAQITTNSAQHFETSLDHPEPLVCHSRTLVQVWRRATSETGN